MRKTEQRKVIAYYQLSDIIEGLENNQQFSVGMDDMLETDKAFTSNISQLFINACKLQLRDHTYTMSMIHFSQNLSSSHLKRHTNLWLIWNDCFD